MTWVKKSAVGLFLTRAFYGASGRWLLIDDNPNGISATDDFLNYVTAPRPTNSANSLVVDVLGACYDGTKWHTVGDNGYLQSTDGLTGNAWAVSQAIFDGAAEHGARAIAAANGRLVIVSSTGKVSLSIDGGATWTVKTTISSPHANGSKSSVANQGNIWIVSCGAVQIARSTDNGDTWSLVTVSGTLRVGPVGAYPGGWLVSSAVTASNSRRSTDNGATWVSSGNPDSLSYFRTTAGALYEWDSTADVVYSYTSGTRSPMDATGKPAAGGTDWFGAGDRLFLPDFDATWGGNVPYVADGLFMPAIITLTFTIEVFAPPIVTLPFSIEVVDGSSVVALPFSISVVEPAVVTLPFSVEVFDAATVGGLDGAGGWPSAPGGRWQPVVFLGGSDISAQLAGQITVTQADNEASVAEFAFRPVSPMLPMGLIGQPVRITFAQWTDTGPINAHTIFSGVVETPSIDLATGLVSCLCHDQLQEIASNTPRDWIDTEVGGRWREEVSGLPADTWDYLQARIASVPKSYALDALQRMRVLPWRGAGLKTATIRQADILDGSLSIDLPSRSQIRTRVTCRMQYRYTRLRGRGALASYSQPIRFYTGDFRAVAVASGGPFYGVLGLTVAMVESAVTGLSGWSLSGPISYDKPAAGSYLLGDVVGDGVYIIPPEVAPSIALGFSARFESRWTQTTTEDYTVTVTLPGVEADTGPIGEEVGATLEAAFDAQEWGSDPAVSPALTVPTAGDVSSAWQPAGADTAARDDVLRTLLDRAWVTLYGSTRSGRVRFALPLRPDLWLDWFPTLEFTALRAAGKIAEITHTLDLDTGAATTEAAIAVGLPGNADASLPTWSLPAVTMPDETRPLTAYGFDLGTHVGGGDGIITRPPEAGGGPSPPFDSETMIGFVTNLDLAFQSTSFNWYPHQLSMRAPTIDALDRDPLDLPVEATIETTIPTDLLEIL
jgi:hypothetical protein